MYIPASIVIVHRPHAPRYERWTVQAKGTGVDLTHVLDVTLHLDRIGAYAIVTYSFPDQRTLNRYREQRVTYDGMDLEVVVIDQPATDDGAAPAPEGTNR